MQPTTITFSAATDPAAELGGGAVVGPSPEPARLERRHFVFGLFDGTAKAEHARRKLRAVYFEECNLFLAAGATERSEARGLCERLAEAGPLFDPLTDILGTPNGAGTHPQNGLAPRITHQISASLSRGGAVLIAVIHTPEQERLAARTLLTCKCDVLLTHELAVRV